MSQTIQDFYRVAQQRDFARDFQLRVLQLGDLTFDSDDLIYIRTAQLPDRQISNHQVAYMGLDFNVPGSVKYPGSDAWDVLFWADAKYRVREKLETWQKTIFDDSTSTGNMTVPGVNRVVTLQMVDEMLNTVKTYNLYGVYVKTLGNIQFDVQGTGAPREFTCQLAYQFWRPGTSVGTQSGSSISGNIGASINIGNVNVGASIGF